MKIFGIFVVALILSTTVPSVAAPEGSAMYSMPLAAPEYGAPPRHYYDSKLVSITFKTTPEVLQKLVPAPMTPNPQNLVSLYIGRFNTPDYKSGEYLFKGDSYLEAGFVVPVTVEKQSGGYSLFLYLNKPGPAISGREIWGFPKKDADIVMTEESGKITIRMERLGTTLLKATVQVGEKVEPIPNQPPKARFNLKYIPSVKRDAPPDVMQITSYLQQTNVKQLYKAKATLELGSSPVDPLGSILVKEIVKAEYLVLDGTVDYGDVVYDYLKQRAQK